MKTRSKAALVLTLVASAAGPAQVAPAFEREGKILEFDTMIGVPRPYTGTTNPIRGLNGGGIPWVVASAKGELRSDGKLEVEVQGLVLATSGQNPVASFRVVVSCMSTDSAGQAVVANRQTDTFPATTGLASAGGGNASVETMVDLPQPCIAPIVFVTSPGGAWFAATGH